MSIWNNDVNFTIPGKEKPEKNDTVCKLKEQVKTAINLYFM